MYHRVKFSTKEKIKAWIGLCNFTFKLIKDNFGEERLGQILKKMRQDHLKANYSMLKGLSKIK